MPRAERDEFVRLVSSRDVTWISNEHPSALPDIEQRAEAPISPDRFLLAVNGEPVAALGPHGQSINWL
jgi:hypothetical protein